MQAVCKPLENFFYEKLSTHLADVTKVPLLAKVFAMRIELGNVEESELIDELIRQVSKKADYDGGRAILMGDMNLHRMLKDLVRVECELKKSDYSALLAGTIDKHLEEVLKTRAVFIIMPLLKINDCEKVQALRTKLKSMKKTVKAMAKETGGKGLQILLDEYV